ncbi:MAG: Crp/Fnr family transcriptional regulator [Anaerolineales bacterium]
MKTASLENTLTAKIAFLRSVPLFANLGEAALGALLADFSPVEYLKADTLFWQGDLGAELYLLRRGKVRIYRLSPGGRKTSINIFCGGDLIGEFVALDQQPRSATAQAATDCLVWRMAGETFAQRLCALPGLSLALNRLLVEKLRWTAEFAETVAQYDAAGRLLHILLLYNRQFGETLEAGKRYKLDLGLNQDDLASLVGASREWTNHLLQTWQHQGWLEYHAGKIIIHDLARMQQERDRRLGGDSTRQPLEE